MNISKCVVVPLIPRRPLLQLCPLNYFPGFYGQEHASLPALSDADDDDDYDDLDEEPAALSDVVDSEADPEEDPVTIAVPEVLGIVVLAH